MVVTMMMIMVKYPPPHHHQFIIIIYSPGQLGGPVAVDAVKRCNQPGNGIRPMTNQNWSLLFTMMTMMRMMTMFMIGIKASEMLVAPRISECFDLL